MGVQVSPESMLTFVHCFFAFEELRKEDEPKGLTLDSYVEIVRNTLKLRKNLCIARRFNILNKQELLGKGRGQFYIDVWPVMSPCLIHLFSQSLL
jgi:hypothetical protein